MGTAIPFCNATMLSDSRLLSSLDAHSTPTRYRTPLVSLRAIVHRARRALQRRCPQSRILSRTPADGESSKHTICLDTTHATIAPPRRQSHYVVPGRVLIVPGRGVAASWHDIVKTSTV